MQQEADGEGDEAFQHGAELGVGLGDFKRDDQQGDGEAEDDVGEAVDAGHVRAAEAKAVLAEVFVEGLHGCV